MNKTKTFYFLLSTFYFCLAFPTFAQTEVASRTWEVQKYDITATLPQAESDRYLTVKAALSLKNVSSAAASSLTLRISDRAEIAAVNINGAAADFRKSEEKIGGNLSLQRLNFILRAVQTGQTASVEVNYKLRVADNSGLEALSPAGSQFLPLSFWYPTPNSWFYSRGADFAPIRLQVNSSNGETVISSGSREGNALEQKLSSQPFLVTGSWDNMTFNAPGAYAEAFLPKGAGNFEKKRAEELYDLAISARDFTAGILGQLPNFPPIRIVSVRRGAGFADGGTILVDEGVFRRQKIDSQTAMSIAEAVAKIWIGGAARVDGEGFGAIREGLVRFVALEFLEKKYGKDIADVERLRQRNAYAAVAKRDAPLNIVSPLDDYFYSVAANKGSMIWRLLAKKVGTEEFFSVLRANMKDGNLSLTELRSAFAAQSDLLDYAFGQVTDTNLLVGLPQPGSTETKIALRNTGSVDVTVNVVATAANGEKLTTQSTIPAKSFGEVTFKTANKIVRVEVDSDKLYPQTDYSDDVAPREFAESDALLAVKRALDKQDYVGAEKSALAILKTMPRFDDARIFLARAYLAQGKTVDAEREFRAVLEEKLPTTRSLSLANSGLGDINLKNGQKAQAAQFYTEAIKADLESVAARQGRNSSDGATPMDEGVKAFFAQFDKTAISGRKADLDALIVSGEASRFSSGISGQAQEWSTTIVQVDKMGTNTALVEAELSIRLLNKSAENATAVFRLVRIGNVWKLGGVEFFQTR